METAALNCLIGLPLAHHDAGHYQLPRYEVLGYAR